MNVRLSVPVQDPRRPSGVKHLPTLWGYAVLMGGWALATAAVVALLAA